jgi:hypothetical protein
LYHFLHRFAQPHLASYPSFITLVRDIPDFPGSLQIVPAPPGIFSRKLRSEKGLGCPLFSGEAVRVWQDALPGPCSARSIFKERIGYRKNRGTDHTFLMT